MTYIENIFTCLVIPMLLLLFFTKGSTRTHTVFVTVRIGMCLLSVYANSFFMGLYKAGIMITAIETTSSCEEATKLLLPLFFTLIFEPDKKDLPAAVIVIAIGFATFGSVCYLTKNGAENSSFPLICGCSTGVLCSLCGIFIGYSVSYESNNFWLTLAGMTGALGVCIGFHMIHSLLITAMEIWRSAGYFFPPVLIIVLFMAKRPLPKPMASAK